MGLRTMKTVEQRLASLEKELAKIPRRGRDLSRTEEDLRNAALQYARMKADGWYMSGHRSLVGDDERESFEETFLNAMKIAATAVLRELGIEEPK